MSNSSKIMITEEETTQRPPLQFSTNPILLCRLPLAADRRYDGSVLLELGESLVHILAVKSGKGVHFSGRHRLACAAHGLENLYHSLLFVILHQLLLVFGQRLQPDLIIWREWYIFALTTSVYCCFYTLFGT